MGLILLFLMVTAGIQEEQEPPVNRVDVERYFAGIDRADAEAVWALLDKLDLQYSSKRSEEAEKTLLAILERILKLPAEKTEGFAKSLPLVRFIQQYSDTRSATQALLLIAELRGNSNLKWSEAVLEKISGAKALKWESSIAVRDLAGLRWIDYERSRGNLTSDRFERLWKNEFEWHETRMDEARKWDDYLKKDACFALFTKIVNGPIRSYEIHNFLIRAHCLVRMKEPDKALALLNEMKATYKASPHYDYYLAFVRSWFSAILPKDW